MGNNCYFTNEQKKYIFKFIIKRQEKLSQKAQLLNIARKTEESLSSKQLSSEKKILEELSQIHLILHELTKDDFQISDD